MTAPWPSRPGRSPPYVIVSGDIRRDRWPPAGPGPWRALALKVWPVIAGQTFSVKGNRDITARNGAKRRVNNPIGHGDIHR